MKDYRKIYERYYECSLLQGIDIHHIDGDHNNNDPLNLQAVLLEEHYSIHKEQKEYYAAYLIGRRLKIKPEDWEQMAKENGRKSAIQNRDNGVGLTVWAKNNPKLAQQMRSENGKKSGKKNFKNNVGLHAASKEQRSEWSSMGGRASPGFKLGHASAAGKIGGKKGGNYAKENKTGIFALSPEKNKQRHMNSVISKLINNGKASAWPRKE